MMNPARKRSLGSTVAGGLLAAILLHLAGAGGAAARDRDGLDGELEAYHRLTARVDAAIDSIEQRLASGQAPIDWALLDRAPAAPPEPAPKKAEIHLDGVAWDPQNPLAFVNNKLVRVNDEVEGFTIVAIAESSVTVRDLKGQTKQLHLYEKKDETAGTGES